MIMLVNDTPPSPCSSPPSPCSSLPLLIPPLPSLTTHPPPSRTSPFSLHPFLNLNPLYVQYSTAYVVLIFMVILLFFVNTVSISSLNFVIISAAAVHLVLASTTGLVLYNRPRLPHPSSASTPILSFYTHPQPLHPVSACTPILGLSTVYVVLFFLVIFFIL